MSRPRFLADEDLRREIVHAIHRIEPAVEFTSVDELGRKGWADFDVLEYAHSHGIVVVSHDVNSMKAFAESRIHDGSGISGLLLAPQANPTRGIAETIVLIWAASEAAEWCDRVAFIPF